MADQIRDCIIVSLEDSDVESVGDRREIPDSDEVSIPDTDDFDYHIDPVHCTALQNALQASADQSAADVEEPAVGPAPSENTARGSTPNTPPCYIVDKARGSDAQLDSPDRGPRAPAQQLPPSPSPPSSTYIHDEDEHELESDDEVQRVEDLDQYLEVSDNIEAKPDLTGADDESPKFEINGGPLPLPDGIQQFDEAFYPDGIQYVDDEGIFHMSYDPDEVNAFYEENKYAIERYFNMVESALEYLNEYTLKVSRSEFFKLPPADQPIDPYWYMVIANSDASTIFGMIRQGTPIQAAAILGNPHLKVDDLRRLPIWSDEDLKNAWGVYNIIVDRTPFGESTITKGYGGKSRAQNGVGARFQSHDSLLMQSYDSLPPKRQMLLYEFGCPDLAAADEGREPAWETRHEYRKVFCGKKVPLVAPLYSLVEGIRHVVFDLVQWERNGHRNRQTGQAVQDFCDEMRIKMGDRLGEAPPSLRGNNLNRSFGLKERAFPPAGSLEKKCAYVMDGESSHSQSFRRWQTGNPFSPLVCTTHFRLSPAHLDRGACGNPNCKNKRLPGRIFFGRGEESRCQACYEWRYVHGDERPLRIIDPLEYATRNPDAQDAPGRCRGCWEPLASPLSNICSPCENNHQRHMKYWASAQEIFEHLRDPWKNWLLNQPPPPKPSGMQDSWVGLRCVNCLAFPNQKTYKHYRTSSRDRQFRCAGCSQWRNGHDSERPGRCLPSFWDWLKDIYPNEPGALSTGQLVSLVVSQRPEDDMIREKCQHDFLAARKSKQNEDKQSDSSDDDKDEPPKKQRRTTHGTKPTASSRASGSNHRRARTKGSGPSSSESEEIDTTSGSEGDSDAAATPTQSRRTLRSRKPVNYEVPDMVHPSVEEDDDYVQ